MFPTMSNRRGDLPRKIMVKTENAEDPESNSADIYARLPILLLPMRHIIASPEFVYLSYTVELLRVTVTPIDE